MINFYSKDLKNNQLKNILQKIEKKGLQGRDKCL